MRRPRRRRLLDARPQQHVAVEAHAEHALTGKLGGEAVKRGAVAVDDGDVVTDSGQAVRQRCAHPAASHHHYTHLTVLSGLCVDTRALGTLQPFACGLSLGSRVQAFDRRAAAGPGPAVPQRQAAHTLLPKRIALPVFASDALSSVAYAPEEIFLVLSVAGLAAYSMAPWIGLAVAAVMLIVIASYRQNVHAYPSGGGDYEVVTTNLGPTAGLTVASALLVDYVLTVAVSMSSAMSNIGSAVPFINQHKVLFAVIAILLLASVNLRGIRESGTAFAIPTYAFMIGMYIMLAWGFFRSTCSANRCAPSRRASRCIPSTAMCSASPWCSWSLGRSRRAARR